MRQKAVWSKQRLILTQIRVYLCACVDCVAELRARARLLKSCSSTRSIIGTTNYPLFRFSVCKFVIEPQSKLRQLMQHTSETHVNVMTRPYSVAMVTMKKRHSS
mmetsp:Transcript_8678/g.16099  ORF Transcript_8678/g.16099 Transcript_8678/m.16099 type:complete len:104 (+) Transcript_8678:150-461(+)